MLFDDCKRLNEFPRLIAVDWITGTAVHSVNAIERVPLTRIGSNSKGAFTRCLFSCNSKHAARGRLRHEAPHGSQL